MSYPAGFPALLESFFTKRLIAQRRASPHTIASYRDTFHVLLQFTHRQLGKKPSQITLEDLNAPLIGASSTIWNELVTTACEVEIFE